MALACGPGVVRWTVAAFTTSPGLLACIQPLHGLTFALFHLAAVRLMTVAPVRLAATAQAIYGTLSVGLSIALVTRTWVARPPSLSFALLALRLSDR
jgi:PPP family 3-phenylpropionic acid transporter